MIGIITAILGMFAGVVRAYSKTNIEKLLMSPGNIILNRIILLILFNLMLMLISLAVVVAYDEPILYDAENYWNGNGNKIFIIFGRITLFILCSSLISVFFYWIFKGKKTKITLLFLSNFLAVFTCIMTIIGYMFMYSLIYSYYDEQFKIVENTSIAAEAEVHNDEDNITIVDLRIPVEHFTMIIILFFMSSIIINAIFSFIWGLKDNTVVLIEMGKESEEFKNGMSFLYSIQPDIQVISPALNSRVHRHKYPQYVYFLQSNKIIKYDVPPRVNRKIQLENKEEYIPGTSIIKRSLKHRLK